MYRFYNDSITRRYLENHDVSDPEYMSNSALAETLTYICEGAAFSPWAYELRLRAGIIEPHEAIFDEKEMTRLTQAACRSFGIYWGEVPPQ